MTEQRHDPGADPESEGIPDLQDATPALGQADSDLTAVPGDTPVAVDDFGTTSAEEREGENLTDRLAREEPDPAAAADPGAAAEHLLVERGDGERVVAPDEGAHSDTEADAVGRATLGQGGLTAEEAAVHVTDVEVTDGVTEDEVTDPADRG